MSDFEVGPSLGRGKFSEVMLAREKKSGIIVALKVMKKAFLCENGLQEQLRREIILQNTSSSHPNVLAILGFFHENDNVVLILEFAEQGDLFSLPRKCLPEKLAAKYIRQTIHALQHLHKNKVIHRDLKPENIFLSQDQVKLGDFGLAIESNDFTRESKRNTFCGTLDYISPEMFQRKGHDYKVDVWSIGVLCFELCAGYPPFEADSYDDTFKRVCLAPLKTPLHFSKKLTEMLGKILKKNPEDRPSFERILEFEWIKVHTDRTEESPK